MWSALLGGIAAALLTSVTGHGPSDSPGRPPTHVPVFAAMTYVGGHSFATFAIGLDTYAIVIDRRAYARTLDGSVGELDLSLTDRANQGGGRSFTLRFGPGPVQYTTAVEEPRSATGLSSGAADRNLGG